MRANVSISTVVVTALSLVPSVLALVPRVPKTSQVTNVQKADEVKAAFQFAWEGYYKYAFPHDELHPVSNTWGNSRCVQSKELHNSSDGWWFKELTGWNVVV